jgi:hypothetical protein
MNKEWQDSIDRYIRHELSEDETAQFRELLHNEAEFREQLLLTQEFTAELERVNEQEVLSELLNANKKQVNIYQRIIAIAFPAAAAVVIFLLLYVGFEPKYSSTRLFEMYYQAMPYQESFDRSTNNVLSIQQKKDIKLALELYTENQYKQVTELLDPIIQSVDSIYIPEEALFYNALSKIEIGNTNDAFNMLQYVSINGESFLEDAQWYLAILYLKQDKRDEAVELLDQIRNEEEYKDKAGKLLMQIKEKRWF